MSEQLMTDWYPANVKPVRPGYYERDWYHYGASRDFFDGMYWHNVYGGVEIDSNISYQKLKWRGLASDPNA